MPTRRRVGMAPPADGPELAEVAGDVEFRNGAGFIQREDPGFLDVGGAVLVAVVADEGHDDILGVAPGLYQPGLFTNFVSVGANPFRFAA